MANPLTLPCGAVLKNRLAKSAMSENMALRNFEPNQKFERVYKRWSSGGVGLIITGNVMIDARYLGEPRNVAIGPSFAGMSALKKWAQAGTQNQTHLWMQINHPGKQSPNILSKEPVAPSAIAFEAPLSKLFNKPRALSEQEVLETIERYTFTALKAKEAGFTGVQIHGAHGYLVSQFLSPRHNQRTDKWGGSLENRMRFALSIYESMRKALGKSFPISIKINSADFQKGGFSEDDCLRVVEALSQAGVDLIEISGGTYEAPKMMGAKSGAMKESTQKREAYFLEFCEKVRAVVKTSIMLTGGFRSSVGIEHALASKACDVVGLARSVALNPDFPNQLLSGKSVESAVRPLTTGIKAVDHLLPLEIIWYTQQIHRMGKGKAPNPKANALCSLLANLAATGWQSLSRVRTG
jgi:2,4-dienoyl-CoA reductase-like NADH-dependent reductase (Old Yellow Enzyme family)